MRRDETLINYRTLYIQLSNYLTDVVQTELNEILELQKTFRYPSEIAYRTGKMNCASEIVHKMQDLEEDMLYLDSQH